jgi:hypothetical protein
MTSRIFSGADVLSVATLAFLIKRSVLVAVEMILW